MRRIRLYILAGIAVFSGLGVAQAHHNPQPINYLKGAFTDIPGEDNAGFHSLVDGGPLNIITGFTGVEFHVPGEVSSAKGGLSPVPHPILLKANGVSYWFISGELSGYVSDELGNHIVIGPIDFDGVSHREETWCTSCPEGEESEQCCQPGQEVPNPRAGLPGAFFALMVPVKNFNGGLIQIEPAADGGTFFPAAPLLYNPVDPFTLLERGYAVFTFGQGGSVHSRLHEDENGKITKEIDTNPYSGSGIFWEEPLAWEEDLRGIVFYTRMSFFDRETREETSLPSDWELELQWNNETFSVPFGALWFWYGSLQKWHPEIMSDAVVFAKNLLKHTFPGKKVDWAAFIGWSGSGAPALEIASNTRGGAFQGPAAAGPQAGGNNFNVWGEPKSGTRFDAFLVYAGVNDFQAFADEPDQPLQVNPKYPISAPLVWFVPEYDVTLPQAAAYDYANQVWQALDKLGRGADINRYIRIYSLPKATHQSRDQLFTAFDSRQRKDGLWFETSEYYPILDTFNSEGRGSRVSPPYATLLTTPPNVTEGWQYFFSEKHALPRDTPLWLQTLANLRLQAKHGIPLPVSRVDAGLFNDIGAVSTETQRPDRPFIEWPGDDEAVNEVIRTIQVDTGLPPFPDGRPPFSPSFHFNEDEVEQLKLFAAPQHPLKRSTEPLLMPDAAVPVGPAGFYDADLLLRRFFTKKEFKKRYGSQLGYDLKFTLATTKLIAQRLWEPRMGLEHIAQELKTNVPIEAESGNQTGARSLGRAAALSVSETPDASDTLRNIPACGSSWRCR